VADAADDDAALAGRGSEGGARRAAGARRAKAGTQPQRRTADRAAGPDADPQSLGDRAAAASRTARGAASRTAKGAAARTAKSVQSVTAARTAKVAKVARAVKEARRKLPQAAPLLRTTDRLVLPPHPGLHVPDTKVALSTASVYPSSTATAFELAAGLGYDGVEVMVWNDPVSQDLEALRRLSDAHRMPILAVHAPCLLITQRVWTTDPWTKLVRARAAAEKLGADTVVVHPPFRWQRQYARDFVEGIGRMAGETDVRFAVENMYPWRYKDREMLAYAPGWDVTDEDYRHFTIDLSHAATSRIDALEMADRMGHRLAHVHLADGSGSGKDEHLIPGRGRQPCAALLERLARDGFDGHVVLEVNTRRSATPDEREADLAEALAFTRLHLAAPARRS
jgi:sugar phosphate isomerase/epimerase